MKWFYDLNMRMKLLVGFAVIGIIAGIIGVISIINISVLSGSNSTLYNNNTVSLDKLSHISELYQRTRIITRDIILKPNVADKNSEVENLKTKENNIKAIGDEYLKLSAKDDKDNLTLFDSFRSAHDALVPLRAKVIELALAKNELEATKLLQSDAVDKAEMAVVDAIANIIAKEDKDAKTENKKASGQAVSSIIFMLVFILLGLVSAGALGLFLSNLISRPINDMVIAAEKLARGDINFMMYSETNDEVGLLSKAFMSVVGTLQELTKETNALSEAVMCGKLDHRAQTDKFKGEYKNLVEGINHSIGSIVNFFQIIPTPIMFMDKDLRIRYSNTAAADMTGKTKSYLNGVRCSEAWQTSKCRTDDCPCTRAMIEKKPVTSENSCIIDGKHVDLLCVGAPIFDKDGKLIGSFEFSTDQTEVKNALREAESATIIAESSAKAAQKVSEYQAIEVIKLTEVLGELANGNLNVNLVSAECDEDTKQVKAIFDKVAHSVNSMAGDLEDIVKEISRVLEEVANGNLAIDDSNAFKGDFASISDSLSVILKSLNDVMGEMNSSADQVAAGSMQVSGGSQALSQGATEQASSVEELTATITEVASQTRKNAINANQANELTLKVKNNAAQGSLHMKDMLKSMSEINESSQNISKIIKVIEDIAFQTNMLALNASVEAARAGQYGRGFAVVAEEVRNLAARSAKAAKETTELIAGSISRVGEGTKNANQTSDALDTIVQGIEQATSIVEDIAKASDEQANAIAQINSGVQQVSRVVQNNSATAEESAAASEELSSQAEILKGMVGRFILKKNVKTVGIAESNKPVDAGDNQKSSTKKNFHKDETNSTNDIKITLGENDFGKY